MTLSGSILVLELSQQFICNLLAGLFMSIFLGGLSLSNSGKTVAGGGSGFVDPKDIVTEVDSVIQIKFRKTQQN